ncbi:MAG: M1 family metallopeptidase [Nonomuraea sp.]|nr:M1 family metallopeptidase [Nonomuraea sp.]NUP63198.1 M1 family metallopeptidase [Nonomuraea sp.]NUP83220.1 M1 family metallopeptidase [Nonomuraea sp.]NUT09866.1 M1 family metallopeptidase [Nonomuraea sp.]
MRTDKRAVAVLAALVSVLACAPSDGPPPHRASGLRAGAPGIGDSDFPQDGNGGYDVAHYSITVDYTPASRRLTGRAAIKAKATQDLSSFNLDLTGLSVSRITVNGAPARFSRKGGELTVTPAAPLGAGLPFTADVSYSGSPAPAKDTSNLGTYGFIPTADGAFVASEPNGSKTWFPNNDHPADKATFDFTITVPAGVTAVANGEQTARPATTGGRTTFRWSEKHPMATYLATATIGDFQLREGRSKGGIPTYAAVDPKVKASLDHVYNLSAEVTDYWSTIFGPYPFSSTGAVVDDYSAGYALENQTKPLYGGFNPDDTIIAHELAHQWFGDSLTIKRWKDLWLNEGFATYAEWLWSEHKGKKSADAIFKTFYARDAKDPMWAYPPGRAKPHDLFNESVYTRGGMTLHALRKAVGDPTFFKLLKTWTAEHRYGNVTTPQFIALAERLSGKDLDALFDAWLFQPRRPTLA